MNWTRADLKARGKAAFIRNYWKCVLVAFVFTLLATNNSGHSNQSTISWKERISPDRITSAFSSSSLKEFSHLGEKIKDSIQEDLTLTEKITSGVIGAGAAALAVIIAIIVVVIGVALALALTALVFNPIIVGCHRFFVDNAYSDQAAPRLMGFVFRSGNYGNVVVTMFLQGIYIFLWSLLLVIPGIIKSYEYRMIPYLLAENPNLSRQEAFRLSKEMMNGQKWDAFVLDLSFIGWKILASITFGILGALYVAPYQCATNAELYLALKGNSYRLEQNTYYNTTTY